MRTLHAGVGGIVKRGIVHAAVLQDLQPFLRLRPKLVDLADLDRLRRTRFSTRGLQSNFLPVVAKSAFEGAAILLVLCDDSKGTRHNAIRAAVAHIRLNEYASEFGAH